jgi:DNA-directed RNA polymerase subunit RPC12/RpoP
MNPYNEKPFGRQPKMGVTLVIKCTKCGGLTLSAKAQKTKICPYCGTKIDLQKAPKMSAADTALEASEILRKLKSIKKQNPKP